MPKCSFYDICNREVEVNQDEGLCILHSKDRTKDESAFTDAFERHRKERGDNFAYMMFPKKADFSEAKFTEKADFRRVGFSQEAFFSGATFTQGADFRGAVFTLVDFHGATFDEGADFSRARFCEKAFFINARFVKEAIFDGTIFMEGVDFGGATFLGKTLFASGQTESGQTVPIFSGIEVGFRGVIINPPDAITFRGADLRRCQFLDTDLRKVQMTGVAWPQIFSQGKWPRIRRWAKWLRLGHRVGVYDEIYALTAEPSKDSPPWLQIEQLYRQLKQNYEDQRDYERAGDFHYGEKEMRRRNRQTRLSLRLLLILYWLVSGYGERILRPLVCAGLLLVISTFLYLWLGLEGMRTGGQKETLSLCEWGDWLQAAHYSFRTMTFLKTDDLAKPVSYTRVVHTAQSLLGPLFLALFALAVRQKLKR